MAFSSGGSKGGAVAAINVTPLVDVVLVLLIIFMVITPMLQRGKEVQLPESKHADEKKTEADPVMVSVTADKKLWVEQDEVELSALESALREKLSDDYTKPIMIKGDAALTVGDVRRVFKSAQSAGAKGVGLAVEQLK